MSFLPPAVALLDPWGELGMPSNRNILFPSEIFFSQAVASSQPGVDLADSKPEPVPEAAGVKGKLPFKELLNFFVAWILPPGCL